MKLSNEHLILVKIQHFKDRTNKMPIVLRNPFDGQVFFVQKPECDL